MKIIYQIKKKLILMSAFVSILIGSVCAEVWAGTFPEVFNLTNLNGTNGFVINGVNPDDFSGYSVSIVGDVNGDGIADILIDSPASSNYVVFGSKKKWPALINLGTLNGANGFIIKGSNGLAVSGAGDVNGDGIADIIIGAPDLTAEQIGQSYVVFGSKQQWPAVINLSSLNGNNGFTINGINTGDHSGSSVSGAGDVNGDGIDDILIGAPGVNRGTGQSYILLGSKDPWPAVINLVGLTGTNGFAINGVPQRFDGSGAAVSGAGDINGDGIDDILIGVAGIQYTGGESYVVFGSKKQWPRSIDLSNLDGHNGFVLYGITPRFGWSGSVVSGAGDVNGDGLDDILIGASGADDTVGQSYVVFGNNKTWLAAMNLSSLNGDNGFAINGIYTNDFSGSSVSGAGDVNGDNLADFLISAYGANNFIGQTYVVFGSKKKWPASIDLANLNGTNGFVINGVPSGDLYGIEVSGGGDVNGDGADDILIGTWDHNNNVGQSYLIFGCCGEVPNDKSFILELALGIGGGVLALTGLSVGGYYGYQHCCHSDYASIQ